MEELFTTLTHAVEGTPAVAVLASLAWGVLSILLSPCHLASIPLIVGFMSGERQLTGGRAFAISSVFAVGILLTIGVIGAVTAAAGRMLGDVGPYGNFFVAATFFLVGLYLLGVVPAPWSGPGQANTRRRGLLAAFLLGLIFGIALGPCTFAYMAPILGIVFQVAATSMAYGILLVAVYGVGHCSVIVAAGTSVRLAHRWLDWSEHSGAVTVLKALCGILVILAGLYLIYAAPAAAS